MKKIVLGISLLFLGILLVSCKNKKVYFDVTFDTDGGTPLVDKQSVLEGEHAVKPTSDPSKDGYTFEYWVNSKTNKEWKFAEDKVVEVTSLVAKYEINGEKITVSFNLNYEGANQLEKVTINKNSKIDEPEKPNREGYEFLGWYNGNTKFSFDSTINTDLTLVAKWSEESKIKVIFDYGYEAVEERIIYVDYEQVISEPEVPIRDGYTFLGWYDDDLIYNFENLIYEDITLIAKWQLEEEIPEEYIEQLIYETGFESNEGFEASTVYDKSKYGGTNEYGWHIFYGSASIGSSTVQPISGEQSLQLRFNASSPSNKPYIETQFSTRFLSKIVFKAKSSVKGTKLKVLYSLVEGEYDGVHNHGGLYELTNENAEYISNIPDTYKNNNVYVRLEMVTTNETENRTNIQIDDLKIYNLKEAKETYNVVFETNGGTKIETKEVLINETVDLDFDVVKKGYKFVGWFTDQELTKEFDPETKITDYLKLYAKWTEEINSFSAELKPTNKLVLDNGSLKLELKMYVENELIELSSMKSKQLFINGIEKEFEIINETILVDILETGEIYFKFVDSDDYVYDSYLVIENHLLTLELEKNTEPQKYKENDDNYYVEYDLSDLSIENIENSYYYNNKWETKTVDSLKHYEDASLETGIRYLVVVTKDGKIINNNINHVKYNLVKFINESNETEVLVLNETKIVKPVITIPEGKRVVWLDANNEEFDFESVITSDLTLTANFVDNNEVEKFRLSVVVEKSDTNHPNVEKINDALNTKIVTYVKNIFLDKDGSIFILKMGSGNNPSGTIKLETIGITRIEIKARNFSDKDSGILSVNGNEKELTNELGVYSFDITGNEIVIQNLMGSKSKYKINIHEIIFYGVE